MRLSFFEKHSFTPLRDGQFAQFEKDAPKGKYRIEGDLFTPVREYEESRPLGVSVQTVRYSVSRLTALDLGTVPESGAGKMLHTGPGSMVLRRTRVSSSRFVRVDARRSTKRISSKVISVPGSG